MVLGLNGSNSNILHRKELSANIIMEEVRPTQSYLGNIGGGLPTASREKGVALCLIVPEAGE